MKIKTPATVFSHPLLPKKGIATCQYSIGVKSKLFKGKKENTNLKGRIVDRINWSKSDINEIKVSLERERPNTAERLSRRLGVDTESVKEKIREIEIKENVRKLAGNFKERLNRE